jgi:Uma2 family endonuclease
MDSLGDVATGVIEYPTSDGKPMAETDLHRRLMIEIVEVLKGHFATDPDVYVSGNLLVLYEEGRPGVHLAPDCFVVRGVRSGERDSFKVWEEGKFPDIVFEVTSKKTRKEDEQGKLVTYRDVWKVSEYVLFDPRQEYLKPSFQGFRRTPAGDFAPIPVVHGQMTSEVLGLRMERQGVRLVFRDPATGRELFTPAEDAARRERLERELGDAKLIAMADEMELAVERERAARAEVEELRRRLDALTNPPPAN